MANWYALIHSCKLFCAVPLATSDHYVGGCASQSYAYLYQYGVYHHYASSYIHRSSQLDNEGS
jgi:hypothetical protein